MKVTFKRTFLKIFIFENLSIQLLHLCLILMQKNLNIIIKNDFKK